MVEEQLSCGVSETILHVDQHTFIRIHNRRAPEIEFIASGKTLVLTKQQWTQIDNLSNNITLAFTLLGEGTIATVQEPKRKKRKTDKEDDTFGDLVDALGL